MQWSIFKKLNPNFRLLGIVIEEIFMGFMAIYQGRLLPKIRVYIFIFLFLFIPFAYREIPHRFKVPPPLFHVSFNSEWEVPPISSEERAQIHEILSHPFTYLNHGNQSYVFESEGGEYVIKLFRYRLIRFPLLQAIKDKVDGIFQKKEKDRFFVKINKTFKAAHMAYVEAKAHTQVVYCHLNLSKHQLPLTQFKTRFCSYYLPMDQTRFVIQKKVVPFKQAMLAARGDPEKIISQIDSLIDHLLARSALGIRNSDPNLTPNFGFYLGQAVEMDFGNYRKISPDPERQWTEINQLITRLSSWVGKNMPEYATVVEDKRFLAKKSFDEICR